MKVDILLTQEQYTCLRDHVPADSPLKQLFESPTSGELNLTPGLPLSGDVVITCEIAEAEGLMKIAAEYCPTTTDAISLAIQSPSR